VWGAPWPEDDADRAMSCALDQLAALERLNTSGRTRVARAGIGIGINFGEVFGRQHRLGPAAGDTVIGGRVTPHPACARAPGEPDPHLRAVLRAAEAAPDVETLDPIQVKGKRKSSPSTG